MRRATPRALHPSSAVRSQYSRDGLCRHHHHKQTSNEETDDYSKTVSRTHMPFSARVYPAHRIINLLESVF